MTDKNERGAWIRRKGRTKLEDTKGELVLHSLLEGAGFDVYKPQPVDIFDKGETWTLTPDRIVFGHNGGAVYLLVQGIRHQTPKKEKTGRWELRLYESVGARALLIDDQLLVGRCRKLEYVLEKFVKFLLQVPDRMLDGTEWGAHLHA